MQTLVSRATGHPRLRDYQEAAVDAVRKYPKPRPVVVAATGAGKTVIASKIAVERLARGPVLFLAHRDELLDQTLERFAMVFDGHGAPGQEVTVGRIQAEANDVAADFAVASVQTLSQPERLSQWLAAHETTPTVITDECHHAAAASYKRIYAALGLLGDVREGTLHLGLTATPYRTDRADLTQVYDGVAYAIGIHDLMEIGFLVPPKSERLEIVEGLEDDDDDRDWSDAEVAGAVDTPGVNQRIVEAWKEKASDRLTIAFCASVEHAYHLADAFEAAGVPVAAVHGALPKQVRRETLAAFSDGKIRVLCNYGVLTEGFDRPEVTCIIMARPTKSHSLYVQCIGRGLRIAPHIGKEDCLVLDVVGVTAIHKLMTVDRLLAEDQDAVSEANAKEDVAARGKRVAKRLSAAAFRWLRVRDGVWLARDFRGRFVRVQQIDGVWHVAYGAWASEESNARRVAGGDAPVEPKAETLYYGADSEMAWGCAATYAQLWLQPRAVAVDQDWMTLPPTPKQVEALQRRGLPVPQTRWEAAELVTLATPRQLEVLGKIFSAYKVPRHLLPDTLEEAAALLDAVIGKRMDRDEFLVQYSRVLPHRWLIALESHVLTASYAELVNAV
ncbi:MAG: DEAD/DEAH box helicase [Alicyclobacillaceae bacterium]|nr:DEAD/DEAH box helicase [Alicyclobacillaceae bacterium]